MGGGEWLWRRDSCGGGGGCRRVGGGDGDRQADGVGDILDKRKRKKNTKERYMTKRTATE